MTAFAFSDVVEPKIKKLNKQLEILKEQLALGSGRAGGTGGPAALQGVLAVAGAFRVLAGEVKEVEESLERIRRSFAGTGGITGTGAGREGGYGPASIFGTGARGAGNQIIKDASKTGKTVFDNWSTILVSNMNTAWATIFGEANSLFEQLINSMADLLVKDIFSRLLAGTSMFGGISAMFGAIGGLFGGSSAPSGQPIVIEIGGMPLGQVVLEGNRQITQLRLV